MNTVHSSKICHYLVRAGVFLIMAALVAGMAGCVVNDNGYTPSQNLEIRTWYDLDAIRDNLYGNHTLMNDLDSSTLGYEELASETAHGGKGWKPINLSYHGVRIGFIGLKETFDGQGYEIRGLFINRPGEDYVGLFGSIDVQGTIQDVGVVNSIVIGAQYVGGLVGYCYGTVSNSYSTGNVTGYSDVGGLVGYSMRGRVYNSYSISSVTGDWYVGGLVGWNNYPDLNIPSRATVSNSYSIGSVSGNRWVGGLVGENYGGTVGNSYAIGNVTGADNVGGLMGGNYKGVVNNSFWDTQTSGQVTSDGGTGKNTTEMKDIATFSGAAWNITAVALNETNSSYIWNIVNNVTYPFLSWQP